jgi:hypothetical protein
MKKSNIFLTAAVLVFLASILAFDYGIKTRYSNGDFRNQYDEFTALNIKDFDTIQVNASTMANVKLLQGPFSVRVFEDRADIVKLTQQGRMLSINVNTRGNVYEDAPFTLIITCPKIGLLMADDKYMENGKLITDTNAHLDILHNNRIIVPAKKVLVDGFTQDSLSIIQNNGSHVRLVNNRFKSISAIVGKSSKSSSFFTVGENNVFQNAYLDIRNKSHLFMSKATIGNLNYKLAPEAKVTFSGASAVEFR